ISQPPRVSTGARAGGRQLRTCASGLFVAWRRIGAGLAINIIMGLMSPAAAQSAPRDAAFEREVEALLSAGRPADAPDLFGLTTRRLGRIIYDQIWREASWSALPRHDGELDALVGRLARLPLRERVERANAWVNARIAYSPDPVLTNHHWGTLAKGLKEHR